jgi:prophage regulatory protein
MAVNILRRPKVLERTGWCISTLYEKMASGQFPRPIKLDPEGRAVGWLEPEVDAYQAARIAARDSGGACERPQNG